MDGNNFVHAIECYANINKPLNCSKCNNAITQDNYRNGRTVCSLCYNGHVVAYYKINFRLKSSTKSDVRTKTDFSNKQDVPRKHDSSNEQDRLKNRIDQINRVDQINKIALVNKKVVLIQKTLMQIIYQRNF